MAKYQKFEELPVWQEAARLYNKVLDLLEEPNVALTPGLRNQLDRAALSVSNNIAEGFERVTTNELNAFLVPCQSSIEGLLEGRAPSRPLLDRGHDPASAGWPSKSSLTEH
jgi:hypothetical protein